MKSVTIVTGVGVKVYEVGGYHSETIIAHIEIRPVCFNGDPFDHYCGFDTKGNILFQINCLVPCAIEY